MILLDTHVPIWLVSNPRKPSPADGRKIREAQPAEGCALASFQHNRVRGSGTIDAIRERLGRSRANVLEIPPDMAALAMTFSRKLSERPGRQVDRPYGSSYGLTLVRQDERILASPLMRLI